MTGPSGPAPLVIITGIMAAGKSTVAQALAERFERSAHVRGDHYRRSIVGGRREMSAEPDQEALDQLLLRYELEVATAERYCRAGFTTILQDIIIGPLLGTYVELVTHRPCSLVVLAPGPDEVVRREAGRAKSGYGALTAADLDAVLRTETPKLGWWLDTTDLSVEETVDRILANLDGPARIP